MVAASSFEISHISRRPAFASGQFHVPAPLDHVAVARCPSGQVASIPERGNPIFFACSARTGNWRQKGY